MDLPPIVAFFATATLAAVGLSPSPNLAGLVGLLVALQLYPKLFSRRLRVLAQPWAASTVGTFISFASPASNALQSSSMSTVLLASISVVVSAISILAISFDAHFIGKNHRFSWFRLAAFPAFWASLWGVISSLSPVGRLLTWSPVNGLGPYTWVSSYLGPWGIDFIVAAWSVVLTETIADPLSQNILPAEDPTGTRNTDNFPPYTDVPNGTPSQDHSTRNNKSGLVALLLVLALPSLYTDTIPNPTYTASITPFTLGCALPRTHVPQGKPHSPTLDEYITETKKMTSAKLVLWPESALVFDSEEKRNQSFEKITNELLKPHKGLHIGLGFEENASESRNSRTSKRNGFALLVEDKIVLQYYKRYLVPIAESFSMLHSDEEPTIYKLPLGPPKGTRKPDWAEGPDYTRPIPITSSICLDFASQSLFLSLDSRPALILAPARTWHPSVGLAMWNQARQRARETGSTILWCDGGEGGLSGIIGGGFEEPLQFGDGSWVKTIGIDYPFPERKTFFTSSWVGNVGGFIAVWMLTGCGGLVIQAAAMFSGAHAPRLAWDVVKAKRAVHGLAGLFHRRQASDMERGEERRLVEGGEAPLVDLDDDEQEHHRQLETTTHGSV